MEMLIYNKKVEVTCLFYFPYKYVLFVCVVFIENGCDGRVLFSAAESLAIMPTKDCQELRVC